MWCRLNIKVVLTSEQQRHKGDQLQKEDIEDVMTQHSRQLNKGKKVNEDVNKELTLSAIVC